MNFAKWNKPGTNETRVYINNTSATNGNKAFITSNGSDGWKVVCFGLFTSQMDNLTDVVEDALAALNGGERFYEFSKVLELV